jgi:uncharacterized cupredoxin-like copper-binding protein
MRFKGGVDIMLPRTSAARSPTLFSSTPRIAMTLRFPAMLSAVVLAALVTGSTAATAQPAKAPAPTPAPAAKVAVDTTIDVMAMGSTLEFEQPEIAVKQGKRVRLRFMNHGTLPHNFVIAKTDDDIDVLIAAAGAAYKTGYVPVELKDRMVGYSTMASPGETVEFVFVVPPPGKYTYVCLISGHYTSMLGTLLSLK